jgi:hypothetical protein
MEDYTNKYKLRGVERVCGALFAAGPLRVRVTFPLSNLNATFGTDSNSAGGRNHRCRLNGSEERTVTVAGSARLSTRARSSSVSHSKPINPDAPRTSAGLLLSPRP